MITGDFTFHKVGQGLFYTGEIKENNSSFNFVYDCGTSSNQKRLIKEIYGYKKEVNKELDVLFISHLHKDHVSGLVHLLKEIKVKNIFIPYLRPIERLLIAIKSRSLSDEELNFIASPVRFLKDISKESKFYVIFKGKNEKSSEIREQNNRELDVQLSNYDTDNIPNELKDIKDIIFKTTDGYIGFLIWKFLLFVDSDNIIHISQILKLDNLNDETLMNILKDKTKLDRLREEHRKIIKDLNTLSLIVYHCPIKNQTKPNSIIYSRCHNFFCCNNNCFNLCRHSHNISRNGTLLSGDTNLNKSQLINYYQKELKNVGFFLVPHHGSEFSWYFNFFEKENITGTSCIVSHGILSEKHPSSKVILDISFSGNSPYLCNELNEVSYHIRV